jgi:catechol 2,3-dioxygenase
MSTASAPIETGRVTLSVNDIDRVGRLCRDAIGLDGIARDGGASSGTLTLGSGNRPLVTRRPGPARLPAPSSAMSTFRSATSPGPRPSTATGRTWR